MIGVTYLVQETLNVQKTAGESMVQQETGTFFAEATFTPPSATRVQATTTNERFWASAFTTLMFMQVFMTVFRLFMQNAQPLNTCCMIKVKI